VKIFFCLACIYNLPFLYWSGDAGEEALKVASNEKGNVERVSTRNWAQSCKYEPEKLFHKLFHDDIKYLLSMDNLWKKRRPPTPLLLGNLPDAGRYWFLIIILMIIANYISTNCKCCTRHVHKVSSDRAGGVSGVRLCGHVSGTEKVTSDTLSVLILSL
jgi:hypothetical protein